MECWQGDEGFGNIKQATDIRYITNCSITCNQNSNEDFPKQQYNHHEKEHSSSSKSEPA